MPRMKKSQSEYGTLTGFDMDQVAAHINMKGQWLYNEKGDKAFYQMSGRVQIDGKDEWVSFGVYDNCGEVNLAGNNYKVPCDESVPYTAYGAPIQPAALAYRLKMAVTDRFNVMDWDLFVSPQKSGAQDYLNAGLNRF